MGNKKRAYRLLLLGLLGAAAFLPLGLARAQNDDPSPTPTPSQTPPPPTDPPSGPVETLVRHTITFSGTSLVKAWSYALGEMAKPSEEAQTKIEEQYSGALDATRNFTTQGLYGFSSGEVIEATREMWKKSLWVAALFFPLVLVVDILAVYGGQGGGGGYQIRAEIILVALRSMLALAAAALSFVLANMVLKIGWGLAELLRNPGAIDQLARSASQVLQVSNFATLLSGGQLGIVSFFLSLFFTILALLLISALWLSYAAIVTVAVVGTVLAPVLLVLGNFDPFRWLYFTWVRIMGAVALLPAANAIILNVSATVLKAEISPGIKAIVALGIVGILISVNFLVGKMVYGPVLAAAKQAIGITAGFVKLAVAGAAYAAGAPGALGMMGGSGAGGGPGGSEGSVPLAAENANRSTGTGSGRASAARGSLPSKLDDFLARNGTAIGDALTARNPIAQAGFRTAAGLPMFPQQERQAISSAQQRARQEARDADQKAGREARDLVPEKIAAAGAASFFGSTANVGSLFGKRTAERDGFRGGFEQPTVEALGRIGAQTGGLPQFFAPLAGVGVQPGQLIGATYELAARRAGTKGLDLYADATHGAGGFMSKAEAERILMAARDAGGEIGKWAGEVLRESRSKKGYVSEPGEAVKKYMGLLGR